MLRDRPLHSISSCHHLILRASCTLRSLDLNRKRKTSRFPSMQSGHSFGACSIQSTLQHSRYEMTTVPVPHADRFPRCLRLSVQIGELTQQNLMLQVLITRTLSARCFMKKQTMMQQPERMMIGPGSTLHVGIQIGLLIPDLFCQQSIRKVHPDHAIPFSLGS